MKNFLYLIRFVLLLGFMQACELTETNFIIPVPRLETISQFTYNSFTANWTSPLGVEQYLIEVAKDEEFTQLLPAFPIQVSGNSKLVEGLTDGDTYYVRVRAIFQGQNTEYSNTKKITTASFQQNYPLGLQVSNTLPTQIDLLWDEVSDASGYILNVAEDANFNTPVSSYFQKDIGKVTDIEITDLMPNTTYYFQLRSYITQNGIISSESAYTPTLSFITLPLPTPLALAPTTVTPLRFTANWESVNEADFYLLDIATDENFEHLLSGYDQKPWFDTSITLDGLDYRSNYYYRIKAKRQDQISDYSATIEVNSAITTGANGCRIKKIFYNKSEPTTFSYDVQGRINEMVVRDRYITNRRTYKFYYQSNTSSVIDYIERYYDNGGLQNTLYFMYQNDDLLDSIHVSNTRNSNVTNQKFTYNAAGKLIHYWEMYNNTLQADRDLEYDDRGNIINIVGPRRIDGSIVNTNWEITYDNFINPFVLLPQEIAFLLPFTLDYNRNIPSLPFFPTRNITFMDFKNSQEVASYDYNNQEIANEQKGFFEISYELENCD